jgi:hypothetical protein
MGPQGFPTAPRLRDGLLFLSTLAVSGEVNLKHASGLSQHPRDISLFIADAPVVTATLSRWRSVRCFGSARRTRVM